MLPLRYLVFELQQKPRTANSESLDDASPEFINPHSNAGMRTGAR